MSFREAGKVYCLDCKYSQSESFYKNEFGNYEGTKYLYCSVSYQNPCNLINKKGDCPRFEPKYSWWNKLIKSGYFSTLEKEKV